MRTQQEIQANIDQLHKMAEEAYEKGWPATGDCYECKATVLEWVLEDLSEADW